METADDFFSYIQQTIEDLETEKLPIQIFTDDLPEELAEHPYHELNDFILNFFAECINQQPNGSGNPLLAKAIAYFESKGIRGTDIDKLVLPESEFYGWNHSILFLSLGKNNEQSGMLKEFGCTLNYDRTHGIEIPDALLRQLHGASLQLKIDHYNRIFPDKIGGKSLRKSRRKSRKRTRRR
jgi:hypothetical protein